MSKIMKNGDVLPVEIMARRRDWSLGVCLFLRQITIGEGAVFAMPVSMEKIDKNIQVPPFLELDEELSQQLIDELWKCGIRPSEGSGSAGMLKATQDHLADMRRLVFKNEE